MKPLTKLQAEQLFREQVLPAIRDMEAEYGNGKDSVMRCEEWSNFLDMLCQDKQITRKQCDNWMPPTICN